jgi:hypothetical protein
LKKKTANWPRFSKALYSEKKPNGTFDVPFGFYIIPAAPIVGANVWGKAYRFLLMIDQF